MNILFLGDVMGKSGRKVVHKELPKLKQLLQIDTVILNGENAAGGFVDNMNMEATILYFKKSLKTHLN